MPRLETLPTRPNVYLGIDPGASGGIAGVCDGRATAVLMPATDRDLLDFLQGVATDLDGSVAAFAAIEKVGGFIQGNPVPGSAMFHFGVSYGTVRMALVASQIPFVEVTPQKWLGYYGLRRGKDEPKTRWKNRLKAKAQQLFPGVRVTLATADALLIAEYCRQMREGKR